MIKVNGQPLDHRPSMTVKDVLDARNFIFPMIVVSVDGTIVPREEFSTHAVPDGADVQVVHLTSGG